MIPKKVILSLLIGLMAVGCANSTTPGQPETGDPGEKVFSVWEYECPDGYRFTARLEQGGDASIVLPDRTIDLKAQMAASGEKYEGNGVTFWSKGDEAFLDLDGTEHSECRVTSKEDAQNGEPGA
jgi:membrane-bound inhibitor of C-type lysozyme